MCQIAAYNWCAHAKGMRYQFRVPREVRGREYDSGKEHAYAEREHERGEVHYEEPCDLRPDRVHRVPEYQNAVKRKRYRQAADEGKNNGYRIGKPMAEQYSRQDIYEGGTAAHEYKY